MAYEQVIAAPRKQIDGKKVGATRMPRATIIGHAAVLQSSAFGAMRFAYCALRADWQISGPRDKEQASPS
jgi:hypothetical protein